MKLRYTAAFMCIIILAVPGCTGHTSAPQTTHTPGSGDIAEDTGKVIFEIRCATCHGTTGAAGIANAANLVTSRIDSASVINTIKNGKGGMPSFKNSLTHAEVHQVAQYVYRLRS